MKVLGYLYEKEIDSKGGTWFKCYVPNGINHKALERYKCDDELWEMEMEVHDPRVISNKQRALVHLLIGDIGQHFGYQPIEKELLKVQLKVNFAMETKHEYFSLSNCSVTLARDFIDYLINFMLSWNVEFSGDSHTMAKITNNWIYYHIMNGKCVCCQRDKRSIGIHLHHTNSIGMGRDRKTIDHSQHKFLTLCAYHHQEAHTMGQKTFNARYHLDGIKLSKESLVELRLMKKCDLTELDEAEAEVNGEHHMQPLWTQGGKGTGSNL